MPPPPLPPPPGPPPVAHLVVDGHPDIPVSENVLMTLCALLNLETRGRMAPAVCLAMLDRAEFAFAPGSLLARLGATDSQTSRS